MAKTLFRKGSFKILSDDLAKLSAAEMNQIIKVAGLTCYQKREDSKKTPEEFIKMLQKKGHFSVLEHSWFCFRLSSESRLVDWNKILAEFYESNSLFCMTRLNPGLIVSGNSRIFNEGYINNPNEILGSILADLNKENLVLFPQENLKTCSFLKLERNPLLVFTKDIMMHRAMTIEFNDHCRGFTHEDVRHRNGDKKIASYSQESTRYVDYAKGEENLDEFQMKFVLPYSDEYDYNESFEIEWEGGSLVLTPAKSANLYEKIYRALRKKGYKPEEARQWLPIGLKSQIVQTYNLSEWRHWFYMRASDAAHHEIRWSAVNLLRETQKRISCVFDDFEIRISNKDGFECAVYTGSDKLV